MEVIRIAMERTHRTLLWKCKNLRKVSHAYGQTLLTESNTKSTRLVYIDIFRCLAILLVIGAHVTVSGYSPPNISTLFDSPPYMFGIFNIGAPFFRGHLGVWIFFCISGLTMAMVAGEDLRKNRYTLNDKVSFNAYSRYFISRRLLRIYPLFFIHLVLCNLIIAPGNFGSNFLSALMLSNLTRENITSLSPVMWSLVVEVQFYLVFPLLYRFIHNNHARLAGSLVLCLPAIGLSHFIFWNPSPEPILFAFSNNLPAFIFFFVFGIGLYELRALISALFEKFLMLCLLSIAFFTTIFVDTGRSLIATENLALLALSSVLAALLMMAMRNTMERIGSRGNIAVRLMSFIGRASYSIYLFHMFPIYFIHRCCSDGTTTMTLAAIEAIAGIVLGCLAYLIIEIPLQKLKVISSPPLPAA